MRGQGFASCLKTQAARTDNRKAMAPKTVPERQPNLDRMEERVKRLP